MSGFALTRPATRLSQLHVEPNPLSGIFQADCVRTAIAMVLGLDRPEMVPHFGNFAGTVPPEGMGWPAFHDWLLQRGVQIVHVPLPQWSAAAIEDRLRYWLGGAPAILQGRTEEGHGHVVAVIDGRIVDTVDYTSGNPLIEPDTDGHYWLTLFVPARVPERPL